jgi:AcrR family transcriptional regulator
MARLRTRSTEVSARIVAAAGEVFGERGFRSTTIRQITARAKVNVAAVNYYFRDKKELYTQVLREAKRHVARIHIDELPGTPEEKFRAFIERFVAALLDPHRPSWHGRVLAMEMANPTSSLGVIIRELTAPFFQNARNLIREIVHDKASPAQLDLLTLSVLGQCIFYVSARPAVEQLAVHLGKTSQRNARIAAHIAGFSLRALRSIAAEAGANNGRPSSHRSTLRSRK